MLNTRVHVRCEKKNHAAYDHEVCFAVITATVLATFMRLRLPDAVAERKGRQYGLDSV